MSPIGTVAAEREAASARLDRLDDVLEERLDAHFPSLHAAASAALGDAPDGGAQLAALTAAAVDAWRARTLDLRVHGEQRAADPDRLRSRITLGASCYADRFAGNLAGLRDEIPYLRDLGVTLLHVQSPFAKREDGTPDLRRIDPGLGSLARLSDLAADLRLAGISLALEISQAGDLVSFVTDALFLADHGVEVFLIGDPDTAAVLRAALAIAAPGVAVIAPSPGSAPLWESLATGDAAPLRRAVGWRSGSNGIAAVRDADAVRWATDAADLTAHYTRGSRGEAVDRGVAGTTASLAGLGDEDDLAEARIVLAHALALSAPGIPMLWLGDEVGQLNDPSHRDDPERRDDARWLHRGQKPRDRYRQRTDATTPAGRLFAAITKLIAVRRTTPEFDGSRLIGFDVAPSAVVAFQRPGPESTVLVLANVGTDAVTVDAVTLSGFDEDAEDLISGVPLDLSRGVELAPCGIRWLRVSPRG